MHMGPNPRRHLIAEFLASRAAVSQEQILEHLDSRGVSVTQATVSRDLAALGALKGHDGYRLPDQLRVRSEGTSAGDNVSGALREHAVDVVQADSIVVIRTIAGHAPLVGDVFDRSPPSGCVGTVAGDDTVFVATTSRTTAQRVARELREAMEGARVA